ncbi:MAG: periplasmic heavy metal sensor [Pseudomonadota bacterium]
MSDQAHENTPEEPPKQGPSRKVFWSLVVVLALSLGLNAATLGFIAGRGHKPPSHHGPAAMMGQGLGPGDVRRAARRMAPEDREILKRAFQERREDMSDLRQQVPNLTQDLRKALKAEPYDPAALTAAFADLRAQGQAVGDLFQGALEEAAIELSPAGRQALATIRRHRR